MRHLALLGLLACGGSPPPPAAPPAAAPEPGQAPTGAAGEVVPAPPPYAAVRAEWKTHLTRSGPSPHKGKPVVTAASVRVLPYESAAGTMQGWLLLPGMDARAPVVVFAHSGYGLEQAHIDACVPMLQAGLAVYLPTWRGENGNPGRFEMFAGEVDDLLAAARRVTREPSVDGSRLYLLGQGAGGQLVALASLLGGGGARGTASVGSLYRTDDLLYWRSIVPFDLDDPTEVRMRLWYPNLAELKVGHIAYVGDSDETSTKAAAAFEGEGRRLGAPLRVVKVKGDEATSLGPAMARFIEAVRADDFPRRVPGP